MKIIKSNRNICICMKIILSIIILSIFVFSFEKAPMSSFRADRVQRYTYFEQKIQEIFLKENIISITSSSRVYQSWYVTLRDYPNRMIDLNILLKDGYLKMAIDEYCKGDEYLKVFVEEGDLLIYWSYPSEKCFVFNKK